VLAETLSSIRPRSNAELHFVEAKGWEAAVGDPDAGPTRPVAIRTLVASGYMITGATEQPSHVEIECERADALGTMIPYLIAVSDRNTIPEATIKDIRRTAEGRIVVLVTAEPTANSMGWDEFLEALGGAVRTWRALGDTYAEALRIASVNQLPPGMAGQPWSILEDLVADGLEFALGRRVTRLGGLRRGQRVSDILALTPDRSVLIVDAKAAATGFNAEWASLRPLGEYVRRQRARQRGQPQVSGAVVVSSGFEQDAGRLATVANDFMAENQLPISFLDTDLLNTAVQRFRERPDLRNAVRWAYILRSGRVTLEDFDRELRAAEAERLAT
jgi:hypothetical protein